MGEVFDPFVIPDDAPKAKETRKAGERDRERSHHAEREEEAEVRNLLSLLVPYEIYNSNILGVADHDNLQRAEAGYHHPP